MGFIKYSAVIWFLLFISNSSFGQSNFFIQNKGQIVNQNGRFNTNVRYILSLDAYNVSFYNDHFTYEIFSKSTQKEESVNVERIEIWFNDCNSESTITTKESVKNKLNFYKNGQEFLNIPQFNSIVYKNIWNGVDIEFLIVDNSLKYNYIVHNTELQNFSLKIKGATPFVSEKSITLEAKNSIIKEEIPKSFFELPNQQKQDKSVRIKTKNNEIYFLLPKHRENKYIIDPVAYSNQYTTYYGGAHMDFAYSILSTKSNDIVVTGYTVSTNNIATTGAYQTTLTDQDAFIAKFNQNGIRLWATYFGGSSQERIYSAALDSNDNIFIAGNTTSLMGIATSGANQTNISSGDDAFITKFSPTGSLIWSSYYGGDAHELITSISIDDSNKIYVTGHTSSTNLPCTPNAYRNALSGFENAFLGVFDNDGNVLYNSYYIKGSSTRGEDIVITKDGTIYVAGYTNDDEVSSFSGIHQNQNGGYIDGFVLKLNAQYQTIWKTYLGGELNDLIEGIAIDSLENIYLTGKTKSTTGIATPNSFQVNYSNSNSWDGFLTQLDSSSNQIWGTYLDAGGSENMNAVKYKESTLWMLGVTDGTSLVTDASSLQQSNNGGFDNVLLNFSTDGTKIWASYFGGTGDDFGYDINFTSNNKILIAGQTGSNTNFATANAHQSNYGGHIYDGFWSILCQPIHPTSLSQNGTLTICEGDSVEVSSVNNFNSYLWSNGNTSNSIYISTTGNYILETIDNNNCPGKSDTLDVVIIPSYDLDIQTSNNAICHNDSTQLSTLNNFSSYTWSNGDTTAHIYINDNQEYYLSVTNNFGCEYFSDTISLPISQYEYQVQLIGDTLICAGGSSILHTDNSNNIVWNTSASSSSIVVNSSGEYYFSGFDSYGCPIVSDTITINEISYNTPSLVLDTSLNFSICWNDSVTLTAENNFDSYLWSNGENTQSTTLHNEGFYYVSATDSNGCVGISDSIEINYKSTGSSIVYTPNGASYCEGDSLLIETDQNLSNVQWNNANNNTAQFITISGQYSYTALDDSGCLTISDTINVVENSIPNVEITPIPQDSICWGDSIFLSSSTSLNQYSWSNGNMLSGSFFNLNILGDTVFYLDGIDQNGCQNQDSILIKVVDCNAYETVIENKIRLEIKTINNQIFIRSSELIKGVNVINLAGQIVYSNSNILSKEFELNTSQIQTGVYLMNLYLMNNQRRVLRKINIYSQ